MLDDWEDWESDDFNPTINASLNKEQVKILEERKLVEESDNALSRDLFNNDMKIARENIRVIDKQNLSEININTKPNMSNYNKTKVNTKKLSNQAINEQKLKEYSQQIKEQKYKLKKSKELYGDIDYQNDSYIEYEDKFFGN